MTLTVKLDEELNRAVRALAQARGETTSWVVREALAEYLVKAQAPKPSAYELGKDLFGAEPAEPVDDPKALALLATNRKQLLREYWEERDAKRRAKAPPKPRAPAARKG